MKAFLLSGAIGAVGGLVGLAWATHAGVTSGQGIPLLLIGMLFGSIITLVAVLSA